MWLLDKDNEKYAHKYKLKINEQNSHIILDIIQSELASPKIIFFSSDFISSNKNKMEANKYGIRRIHQSPLRTEFIQKSLKKRKKYKEGECENYTEIYKYDNQYSLSLMKNILIPYYSLNQIADVEENSNIAKAYLENGFERFSMGIKLKEMLDTYLVDSEGFLHICESLKDNEVLLNILISQYSDITLFKKIFSYCDLESVKRIDVKELKKFNKIYQQQMPCLARLNYEFNEAKQNTEIAKQLKLKPNFIMNDRYKK